MSDRTLLILLGIAGLGATFAGFSGVVAVFDRRARGVWFPEERFRLINLMILSLGVCALAFVPALEELLHVTEPTLWTIASALLGVFSVSYLIYLTPERARIGHLRPKLLAPWAVVWVIASLMLAATLQGLNALGVFFAREPGPYVAGLLLLLGIAGLQFAFLVLSPVTAPGDGTGPA